MERLGLWLLREDVREWTFLLLWFAWLLYWGARMLEARNRTPPRPPRPPGTV